MALLSLTSRGDWIGPCGGGPSWALEGKHVSVSADLWVLCDFSSGAGTHLTRHGVFCPSSCILSWKQMFASVNGAGYCSGHCTAGVSWRRVHGVAPAAHPRAHSLPTATLSFCFPLTSEPLRVEETEDGGNAKGDIASCPWESCPKGRPFIWSSTLPHPPNFKAALLQACLF